MKRSLHRTLIAITLVFIMTILGLAQKDPIVYLKQQIAEMETIDRDPATSPEVRKLNREFLLRRRQELFAALQKAIEDLQNYQARVSLSREEKGIVEASIAAKETDLKLLDGLTNENPTTSDKRAVVQSRTRQPAAVKTSFAIANGTESAAVSAIVTTPPMADCIYTDVPEVIRVDVENVASDIVERNDASRIGNIGQRSISFAIIDALTRTEPVKLSALKAYTYIGETTRTDKQLGSTAASGGSTSAIEKPGWSDLLGFAIEHGAIQQQVGNTTLTLSSTPYAFFVPSEKDTAAANRHYGYLKRLGLSASFNISDKNAGLANATRKNLSQYSAKLRLTPERGPNSKEFDNDWQTLIKPAIQSYLDKLSGGIESIFGTNTNLQDYRTAFLVAGDTDIKTELAKLSASLGSLSDAKKLEAKNATKAKVAAIILCALKTKVFDEVKTDGTGKIKIDKATADHLVGSVLPGLIKARGEVGEAKRMFDQMLKEYERKPEASISYVNNRPTTGTEYGTLNFLYQRYLGDTPIKMTFNAGPSFYHRPDAKKNQSTFRDLVATLSLEGRRNSPFNTTQLDLSPMTYSLTARYQRLQENRGLPKKKADLAVVQFKLDIPVAKGFSVPLSLTYANATEQQHEKTVRGNFGVTFDVDKFLAIKKLLSLVQ